MPTPRSPSFAFSAAPSPHNHVAKTQKRENDRAPLQSQNYTLFPDGIALDNNNGLWVAHWAGGQVSRINLKNCKIDHQIKLPALNITSVTFVGKKLSHLFITSAKLETSKIQLEQYKHSGSSFIIKTGFEGLKIPYGTI